MDLQLLARLPTQLPQTSPEIFKDLQGFPISAKLPKYFGELGKVWKSLERIGKVEYAKTRRWGGRAGGNGEGRKGREEKEENGGE